jgi:predicted porin
LLIIQKILSTQEMTTMRKALITVAALGAFAGGASAQSITLFGVIDLGVRAVKNGDGSTFKSLTRDGLASSRIGFRGQEDLGGGVKASFWLESAVGPDLGTAGTTPTSAAATGASADAKFFDRRSTVSLSGPFGEVRLGRDYTPTFTNVGSFDVYGATGFAGDGNLAGGGSPSAVGALGSGAGTRARADNSVAYFLPSILGGLNATVMAAAGEGTNTSNGNNRYIGARIGYAAGPIGVAGAYGRTRIPGNDDFRVWNAGASYDFSVVKLVALYHRADYTPAGLANRSQKLWVVGARVALGQGEFRATYQHSDISGGTIIRLRDQDDARQYAVGYIYNLSKRTALYADVGRLENRGLSALALSGGTTTGSGFGTVADRNSTGMVLGVRHSF